MSNIDKEDLWFFTALSALLLALGILFADGIGRLGGLCASEWPYISTGLAILGVIGVFVFLLHESMAMRDGFESKIRNEVNTIQENLQSEIKLNAHKIYDVDQMLDRLKRETENQKSLFLETQKKLKELLEQKTPLTITTAPTETSDSTIMEDVVSELMGGSL